MKLENILKVQELAQKRNNYIFQKQTLENEETNIKNNEDVKMFVLRNIELIDDKAQTIAHLNALKNVILQEINKKLNDIEQELLKID